VLTGSQIVALRETIV